MCKYNFAAVQLLLLTEGQLGSIGCDTIHSISENTGIVSLICLHSIHHSQVGSGSTTVVGVISQISSILLPLVGEVTASGLYCEHDDCPWNHILLTCRIRSDDRVINWEKET